MNGEEVAGDLVGTLIAGEGFGTLYFYEWLPSTQEYAVASSNGGLGRWTREAADQTVTHGTKVVHYGGQTGQFVLGPWRVES